MKISIITDTASDLPDNFIKENNIVVLPVEITFGNTSYLDGVSISKEEFYRQLMACKQLPKTSLINATRWQEIFEGQPSDTTYFVMPMSKELSGSYNAAKMALEEMGNPKNFILFDLNQITLSQAAIIMETVKLIKQNLPLDTLLNKINYLINHCVLFAYVDDLKYLRMGGRLSGATAFIGGMLNIKPIITIKGGKVEMVSKAMGGTKACKTIINMILENYDSNMSIYFGRAYYENPLNEFKLLFEKSFKLIGNEQVLTIGSTVGTHVGPGAVGVVYFKKWFLIKKAKR